MKYFILSVALFSVSACMKPQEPAKIACIDGLLHEETTPNSGVYVPIYEYSNGTKQDAKACRTLGPATNVASNQKAAVKDQNPNPSESY